MKFIVLRTLPYQDRHLLIHLLSEQGNIVSAIFFGGQVSPKKKTGQKVHLGQMIKIKAPLPGNRNQEIKTFKEFELLWSHNNIRHQYHAWILLQAMFELLLKVIPESSDPLESLVDGEAAQPSTEYETVRKFVALIDEWSVTGFKAHEKWTLWPLFFAKILHLQGLSPSMKHCQKCLVALRLENVGSHQGGHFYCLDCHQSDQRTLSYWSFLKTSSQLRYEILQESRDTALSITDKVKSAYWTKEFCQLLDLPLKSLKTWSLVFEEN